MAESMAATILQRWAEAFRNIPPGLGCRLCHDNPPFRDRVCLACLIRVLGWDVEIVLRWVEHQDATFVRQEARREALRRWNDDGDPSGIIEYAERYGVWLVDARTLHVPVEAPHA